MGVDIITDDDGDIILKELLKKLLKWLNYESVSVFARFQCRKQAKMYCEKNNIPQIDRKYQKEIDKQNRITAERAGAIVQDVHKKMNLDTAGEKIDDIESVKSLIRNIEMPDRFDYSVFDSIEEKFNVQQDKIDMLEDKINRLTELVEANDNTQITKKISSVDRQLAKLNKSIERLTSYVDEE